mgnify:CR=1 FL=1
MRPMKLRLVVDAERMPRASVSPFEPPHIEQLESRHSNPASRKIRSRPSASAWRFTPLREDACKVSLTMDFEFAGALIDKAFGAVFHQIANSLVDAFCKQADEVYRG